MIAAHRFRRFLIALLLTAVLPAAPRAEIPEDLVLRTKKSVVNVRRSLSRALNGERAGRGVASGFVVDAERGIIATRGLGLPQG